MVSDQVQDRGYGTALTRRDALTMGLALASGAVIGGSARPAYAAPLRQATPVAGTLGDQAEAILAIARDIMDKQDVKAVILRVTIDGQEIVTEALGESMTGVPATPEMHFRNGAVAISYMATLLLRLVDQNLVTLDDTIDAWLPDLPDAAQVTLRMLANMTAGYPDFEKNAGFQEAYYADPFRRVDHRGADRDFPLRAAGLRAGDQLGLLAQQLCDHGAGPGKDHRPAAGRRPARAGARSHGLTQHGLLVDAGDLGAGPARLQLGATASSWDPHRHALL